MDFVDVFIKTWDIPIILFFAILSMMNWIFFYFYLREKKPSDLDKLENKHSILKLPIIINLDPIKFLLYLIKIRKNDDDRIVTHKIVHLICFSIVLPLIIYALIIRRFI